MARKLEMESEKLGNIESLREQRALRVVKNRVKGMSWLQAWKKAAPDSRANRKSATDMAKIDFRWYRETHREEVDEMFNAHDMDALFVAEEILKVIKKSRIRVGSQKEITIQKDSEGKEIGRTIVEKPLLFPDSRAILAGVKLMADLRGWLGKDGENGNTFNFPGSQTLVQVQQIILDATKDMPEVRKQLADQFAELGRGN